ncbi:MAG: gamma carbonic anhydrase family protein [Salinibacterium sp.]|nr:gamma carbonic anhydrase family protein [Salinibacterium sp.]
MTWSLAVRYRRVVLVEHRGKAPTIHPDAWVAPTATVVGEVSVASGARILHGAVVSSEDGRVTIGENTIVMENALVRARAGHDVTIGASVMIGPHAHVNGAIVHDEVFIATGASLFPGSVIGEGAEVRINGVVQVNTTVQPGTVVPIGWVAVGDQILSPDKHDEIWAMQRELDFAGTVYGAGRGTTMKQLMQRQSEFYGAHRDDHEL